MKSRVSRLVLLFLTLSLLLTGTACGKESGSASKEANRPLQRYTSQFTGPFDTVTSVVGYAENEENFNQVVERIWESMDYYHRLFSIYDKDDQWISLAEVNERAEEEAVKVEAEVIEVLEMGKKFHEESSGQFNIALGAVLSHWHDARESEKPVPPGKDLLQEANKHTNIDDLILDAKKSEISFRDPLLKIDVGALAKGWAVERIADELEADGISHFLISAGGNVRALGAKPDGSPWTVGVRHPDNRNEAFLDTVKIIGGSVVTSGIYERFFEYGGKSYHHIIDARSLYPSTYYQSVTIICDDSGVADALSTSLFNLSEDEGDQLAEKYDAAVLRMFSDGTVRGNKAWERLKKEQEN